MFVPKKTKFRKFRKIRSTGKSCDRGSYLAFGDFGLKAESCCKLDARQLEAARRVITRVIARNGKLWFRCFPGIPVTKKPADVRMGGGKGSVDKYVFSALPGRVLFEIGGVDESLAKLALVKAAAKLPCSVRFISRSVLKYEV